MTDTNMTAAELVAEAASPPYMGDNIPVTCNCQDPARQCRDIVSHQQYYDAKRAFLIGICPNCKGGVK